MKHALGIEKEAPTDVWTFKRRNCWEKIYKSILDAKHFIYITGWSVDTSISLLRERPIYKNRKSPQDEEDNGMLTIGELLKRKAKEGVRVNLLLWNEATSMSGSTKEGMMATHDEITKKYFSDSSVCVSLVYRDGNTGTKFLWTHHQKSIILDAPSLHSVDILLREPFHHEKRRVIAFIGGLDLCDGRWDTPEHSLYNTLETYHKTDFHMVWPGVTSDYGPREPWHDIHSFVEGPIAYDILSNFEQRWKKQKAKYSDRLLNLSNNPNFISINDEDIFAPHHWNSWNIQLFRSIDKFSANLDSPAITNGIDKSIQIAYAHHIRRAKRFIFIENQYFIGSSQAWINEDGKNVDCPNIVPYEITLRIIQAIKSNERFTAYILIPLYPEGNPSDGAVQEILFWQKNTIQMMYHRIYLQLKKSNSKNIPEDYLNFYCLGRRELINSDYFTSKTPFDAATRPYQVSLNKYNRFAIYIHSKMMIIDDDYIILGSANINERSLAGNRDTEIAIGAYQPHYTSENSSNSPRGDIHGFRMALWTSHMRRNLPCFLNPESIDCVQAVNKIATKNWKLFADAAPVDMSSHGHLLKYPLKVSETGTIGPLPGYEFIPDTTAPVVGVSSNVIPDILTL